MAPELAHVEQELGGGQSFGFTRIPDGREKTASSAAVASDRTRVNFNFMPGTRSRLFARASANILKSIEN
jgi:hypothetical protein